MTDRRHAFECQGQPIGKVHGRWPVKSQHRVPARPHTKAIGDRKLPAASLRQQRQQRVDHHIADKVNAILRYPLCHQVGIGVGAGGEEPA